MSKVAIIGSGFVGCARAISFSRAGHDVALLDQDPQAPEKALTYIRGLLPDLEASDLLNGAATQVVEARMRPAAALEAALDGAASVQENTPENVEVKRVGLEDSLWSGAGRLAQSNAEQVRAAR